MTTANYIPRIAVAISKSAHPAATSQKANAEIGGMTTRVAKTPTTPRIKAMIQTICDGALSFIFIFSS
jgi:hypothetical protein